MVQSLQDLAKQPLIDVHHHLWALDGSIGYDWLENPPFYNDFLGDYSAICRPFLLADLHKLVPNDYELLATVHCEAECNRTDHLNEIAWIDKTAKLCQSSHTPVKPKAMVQSVWLDVFDKNFAQNLSKIKQTYHSVRGLRAKPDLKHLHDKAYQEHWHRVLDTLSACDVLWELRLPSEHLAWGYELLKSHQDLTVAINHCGLPWDRSDKGLLLWQHALEKMSSLPNVHIKLSELKCPNKLWDFDENLSVLQRLLASFDPKKALFASNAPVSLVNCAYAHWLNLVETAIAHLTDDVRQAILWQSAKSVYRIDLAH